MPVLSMVAMSSPINSNVDIIKEGPLPARGLAIVVMRKLYCEYKRTLEAEKGLLQYSASSYPFMKEKGKNVTSRLGIFKVRAMKIFDESSTPWKFRYNYK